MSEQHWSDEPVVTTFSIQIGEMPRAYRGTWEVRNGYCSLTDLDIRHNGGEWKKESYFRKEDSVVAKILTEKALAIAGERFQITEVDAVDAAIFSA